jgi:hypothetical protein
MQTNYDLQSITGGPLKPHEYVLVKSRLNAGDTRYIQNRSTKARKIEGSEEVEIVMTLGDSQFATMQRAVKGWNLTKTIMVGEEEREVTVPFIPEKLEQILEELDQEIYTYLLEQINKLYAPKAGSESPKNFQTAVIDSSEDNLDAERVLRLKA